MSFKFEINEEFEKLTNLQVSQTISNSEAYLEMSKSEYNLFSPYIKRPKIILELGCGLGRMSTYINYKLHPHNPFFILADSTNENKKPRYGWNHDKNDFYNDLELTSKFVKAHGLTKFQTINVKKNELIALKDIDLVVSFLAIGFHNKIEDIINTLMKITTEDCTMIFGVRRNRYNKDSFKEYFNDIQIIENTDLICGKRTKEDILILNERRITE